MGFVGGEANGTQVSWPRGCCRAKVRAGATESLGNQARGAKRQRHRKATGICQRGISSMGTHLKSEPLMPTEASRA